MKKLIWTVIVAFGLAALPFGGSAFAGQGNGKQVYKTVAKAGKHHGKKHHNKPAGKKHKQP